MTLLSQFIIGAVLVISGLGICSWTFYQVADAFVVEVRTNNIMQKTINILKESHEYMSKEWQPKPSYDVGPTPDDIKWAESLRDAK